MGVTAASTTGTYLRAGALAAVSLVVNSAGLGTRSLQFDEATSVTHTRLDPGSLLRLLSDADPNGTLYYLLLYGWVRIVGESEAAVRSLSALCAALAVGAVFLLGTRLFDRWVGAVAALFLACNAFIIQYAQTARGYTLMLFLVTVLSYLFIGLLERPSRRGRVAYAIVGGLAVYAHYFAAYALLVHGATLVALKRRAAWTPAWIATALAIVLMCAPAVWLASTVGPTQVIGWIHVPALVELWSVPVTLTGGNATALVIFAALGLHALAATRRETGWWTRAFLAAWFLVPIAIAFAASWLQPMFLPNYLIATVPALALLAASAARRFRAPLDAVVVLALVVLCANEVRTFNPPQRAENWRDATARVASRSRPGDTILFFPAGSKKPFEYYWRRQGRDAAALPARATQAGSERVWLLIRESDAPLRPAELAHMRSSLGRYRLAERHQFRRLGVELYVR